MIVFFRLMWALIRTLFKARVDILDESAVTMRVWPNDLDLNVHMNSGRYLSMMDIGRVAILAHARQLRRVFRRGWRPIAAAATIRYRRSLLPFQRFTVRSRVLCWDEKWFYFRHAIDAGGDLCAIAYVRGLLRGPEGNVLSAQFLDFVGKGGTPSPPMPEDLAKWIEAELH